MSPTYQNTYWALFRTVRWNWTIGVRLYCQFLGNFPKIDRRSHMEQPSGRQTTAWDVWTSSQTSRTIVRCCCLRGKFRSRASPVTVGDWPSRVIADIATHFPILAEVRASLLAKREADEIASPDQGEKMGPNLDTIVTLEIFCRIGSEPQPQDMLPCAVHINAPVLATLHGKKVERIICSYFVLLSFHRCG